MMKACVQNLKLLFVTGLSKLVVHGLRHGGSPFTDLTNDVKFGSSIGLTRKEVSTEAFWPYIYELGSNLGLMIDKTQCQGNLTENQCTNLFLDGDRCKNGLNEKQCIEWVKENKVKLWSNITRWYDGYTFAAEQTEKLLNPYSFFECLRRKSLGLYWKHDSSVAYYGKELSKRKLPWNYYENYYTSINMFSSRFSIKDIIPLTMEMFISALLTIKSYDSHHNVIILHFPNDDIKEALKEKVQVSYTEDKLDTLCRNSGLPFTVQT